MISWKKKEGMGGFSFIEEPNIIFTLIPLIVYSNVQTDKSTILTSTKGKAAIYQWTHKESGRIYIGSALDLSNRLKNYFNKSFLNKFKTMYIYNALLHHGYSAFTLSIIEFIDISSLSDLEARDLILSREQVYLDQIFSMDKPNTYNILTVAGSSLGYNHSEGSKALISEAHKGKTLSFETIEKMSKAKTGENHPMFGKYHSADTKTLMGLAKSGIPKTEEAKAKISIAKGGGSIFVYNTKGSLVNTFCSAREAGKHFGCTFNTILKYAKNGELFKDEWKLSTSLIIKE